jgi:ribonuclease J
MMSHTAPSLKIIPIAGATEPISCFAVEYNGKLVVIDAGAGLVSGKDYTSPPEWQTADLTYLLDRKADIEGIFLTNSHTASIDALVANITAIGEVDIFGSAYTLEVLKKRFSEQSAVLKLRLTEISEKSILKADGFEIHFIPLGDTAPGNFGMFIHTPAGNLFYAKRYRFDDHFDLQQLVKVVGKHKIDILLLGESENLAVADFIKSVFLGLQHREGRVIVRGESHCW